MLATKIRVFFLQFPRFFFFVSPLEVSAIRLGLEVLLPTYAKRTFLPLHRAYYYGCSTVVLFGSRVRRTRSRNITFSARAHTSESYTFFFSGHKRQNSVHAIFPTVCPFFTFYVYARTPLYTILNAFKYTLTTTVTAVVGGTRRAKCPLWPRSKEKDKKKKGKRKDFFPGLTRRLLHINRGIILARA